MSAKQQVTLLGVRHHGPGSARAVERALAALDPDCVLIEGPPEGTPLLGSIDPALVPPVAILCYAPKLRGYSSFTPLTEFSPEWRAALYARERGVRCALIDLPQAHRIALRAQADGALALAHEDNKSSGEGAGAGEAQGSLDFEALAREVGRLEQSATAEGDTAEGATAEGRPLTPRERWAQRALRDPLGCVAELAQEGVIEQGREGDDDLGDRWWERVVESRGELTGEEALRHFEALHAVMCDLRAAVDEAEAAGALLRSEEARRLEVLREASMRALIQKEGKGASRVVVVCGAWHTPALARAVKGAEDSARLKGLPKEKVEVTWAPWSEARLAQAEGYGAGVLSPAWCRYLWRYPSAREFSQAWIVDAARLLRAEGIDASSAHAIEAARLAEQLAALREHALPDLYDLLDALESALGLTQRRPLSLIRSRLVRGDRVGSVPQGSLRHPLALDFEAQAKSFKIKLLDEPKGVSLDLRDPFHQGKSAFLHRVTLLAVPFATFSEHTGRAVRGTAREEWTVHWRPEGVMALIDAGTYGDTVEAAAVERVRQLAERGEAAADPVAVTRAGALGAGGGLTLTALCELLTSTLRARLPRALPPLLRAISHESALTQDLDQLLDALPALIWTYRYRESAGGSPSLEALPPVISALTPRACVGLPGACVAVGDAESSALATRLITLHRALLTAGEAAHLVAHRALWRETIREISRLERAHPRLRGLATRLAHDQGWLTDAERLRLTRVALSPAEDPSRAALWLEGLLTGGGLILVYARPLRALLDAWVCSLTGPDFVALLPLLRRAFAAFSFSENRQLGEALARDAEGGAEGAREWAREGAAPPLAQASVAGAPVDVNRLGRLLRPTSDALAALGLKEAL